MNQTLATFSKIKASVGRQHNARTTMYDQTPESLCYMNQLKDLIFSECMMLVTGDGFSLSQLREFCRVTSHSVSL
jgi:hypothetical protein